MYINFKNVEVFIIGVPKGRTNRSNIGRDNDLKFSKWIITDHSRRQISQS